MRHVASLNSAQGSKTSIKNNKYLFTAGICFLIYSIIEISDCISIVLIALNLMPNLYLSMTLVNVMGIRTIMEEQPILLFPFFLSFTLMRIFSTIGILKNYMWGLYIGIFGLVLTMLLTMLFLPIGFFEIFFCTIILILLLIGYFGKKPILS